MFISIEEIVSKINWNEFTRSQCLIFVWSNMGYGLRMRAARWINRGEKKNDSWITIIALCLIISTMSICVHACIYIGSEKIRKAFCKQSHCVAKDNRQHICKRVFLRKSNSKWTRYYCLRPNVDQFEWQWKWEWDAECGICACDGVVDSWKYINEITAGSNIIRKRWRHEHVCRACEHRPTFISNFQRYRLCK